MKRILKFYSETCGPCRVMSKRLEGLKNVKIQEIDINDEDNETLLDEWKIRTIPTVIVLAENGDFIAEFKGIVSIDRIQEALDK